ncbi:cytochrome P450 [Xylariaceae sp. FL0594]|nr:cytochrome P450 [Xylariaceae sp. FL0594]
MPSIIVLMAAAFAVVYSFLRALLFLRRDSREPKPVVGTISYLSPLLGMLIGQDKFYQRLRDETRLPIYTLNIPGVPVYIVNSLEVLQRVCSVSQAGLDKIYGDNILAHDGFLYSHQRASAQAGAPGASLNTLSRSASAVFAAAFDRIESRGRTTVDLYDFVRQATFEATMDAIILAKNACKARKRLVAAFVDYFGQKKYLQGGSLFLELTQKVNDKTGLSLEDKARIEVGQVAAATFNTAPGAYWCVRQVLADLVVFKDCREEVMRLVDETDGINTIDLARVRTECPLLVSTLQEGGAVLMPNSVFHTDQSLWGPTVREFDHTRFLKTGQRKSTTKHPAAAFRGCGGGHVLCPGRHLASTEMLALMALILVRVDVVPPGGSWPEAKAGQSTGRAFPLPKGRTLVEFVPRAADKWRVVFSDNDKHNTGINLVAEDIHSNKDEER